MSYSGPNRRRHTVYVTRNTEYHVRDNVCVAVRDRTSRSFRDAHLALKLRLEGGIKFLSNGAVVPHAEAPGIGDSLFFVETVAPAAPVSTFDDDVRQIITSRIERTFRPPKVDVQRYPMN